MRSVRRVVGALASVALLTACSSDEGRGPRPIVGWSAADDVLHLWLDTCNGDPEFEVVHAEDAVTVTVISTKRDPGDACQDTVTVTLDEALGDRTVVDGATGREAPPMEG
ncbi:hypothetical protein [Modestobacter sp. VKM Ac-2985]|uniref:hypothetical protein n=1 Tax=Modestobacter sp. VKM Ac-2985 TaxID=3004139 RepID=UPI0022ABBC07|nr:hypothetical protein [Modestobacter sp. VKM Ac-2985]MCZ2837230.1 hypothetical protein [Modestobacter sp. VKM Ac-2985]